ncbi:MAG: twin-arginine translocase TatA/TatE family subunit [Chloroflexaceae bacterium]|nr:twin-arginine translocase TatA/TatE family subunit [Chloroflexaceae bacterium]
MEIFNIHIFEFLLIAALALVVFGPERLPEVGRFIGKQVARFLAWQQQSPELRLINDIRSEFEREIASLRDELIRTRNQLDVSQDVEQLRSELRPMLDLQLDADLRPRQSTPANPDKTPAVSADSGASVALPEHGSPSEAAAPPAAPDGAATLADAGTPVAEPPTPPTLKPQPASQAVPATASPNRIPGTEPTGVLQPVDERARYLAERRSRLHDLPDYDDPPAPDGAQVAPPSEAPPATLSASEREELLHQIQALSSELRALVGELRERGVIGMDWTPNEEPSQETLSR